MVEERTHRANAHPHRPQEGLTDQDEQQLRRRLALVVTLPRLRAEERRQRNRPIDRPKEDSITREGVIRIS